MKSPILIILAAISGVWSGSFKVTFGRYNCALRRASVVIGCWYDYPFAHFVTSVGWSKQDPYTGNWRLVQNPRYKYVGDFKSNCHLQITDVQPADAGNYIFSFRTTLSSFTSETIAQLSVKDLMATVEPSTAVEGDSVRLTCTSGCRPPADVVWSREGWPANEVFRAKRGDAGMYQCSVRNQQQVKSAPVPLNVLYPPDSVTLSISPGGTVVKGSAVTLSCSSDARPPVEDSGYSLYREGSFVGMGREHAIPDAQPGHNGRYHCQAWNSISSGGEELFHSAALPLRVYYKPVNVSIEMNPAQLAWGSGVNLSCSGTADPPVDAYAWYRRMNGSGLLVGSGQVLSIDFMEESLIGPYFCQARNQVGGENSTEVLLTMVEEQGPQTLPAVAGVVLSLTLALGFALLLLWFHWKKRSLRNKKGAEGDFSQKQPDNEDLYANIGLGPLPPALHSQQPSQQDSPTSVEGEVTYSTVNIRSRGLNDSADVHCSWSKNNTDQTIYSTVKSS